MTAQALLLVTVAIVAWLTAAATAVRFVSRIWLRHWAEQQLSGSGAAQLYLERPQRLLLTAATGVALTVFAGGFILAASARGSAPLMIVEAAVYAMALLVVGQLVPRAIGRRWAAQLVPMLLPPLQLLDMILGPALRLAGILAGSRLRERDEPAASDEEALEELLREGELEGVGEPQEIAIISGVMQFAERRVRDVMTQRADIFAVPEGLAPGEMALRIAASGYSRVPVYRGSLDDVTGIVRSFDLLKNGGTESPTLRPVATARPGMPCRELLSGMLKERRHIAIVREEGGPVIGLVTLEDLLEELVGEIRDEHDEPSPSLPTSAPTVGASMPPAAPSIRGARPNRAAAPST